MNSKVDDMFPQGPLTERDIRDYVEGKLSAEEQNRVERIAASNPLFADAIEGYQKASSPVFPLEMKGRMKRQLGLGYTRLLRYSLLIFTSVFLAWISYQASVSENKRANTTMETDKSSSSQEIEASPDQETVVYAQKRTDSSVSVVLSKPANTRVQDDPFKQVNQIENLDFLQPHGFVLIDLPDKKEESPLEKSGQRIYHVVDYKVVDYRGLRDSGTKLFGEELGGVSAAYSSADEGNMTSEPNDPPMVSYVDYCEQAIIDYSKGRWRDSEIRFQDILKTYPDDANALFYGAMSSYQLRDHKTASDLFKRSLSNEIITFHDESEFYLAQCYWNLGKEEQALESFHIIIERGGFYARQAEAFLQKHP